MGEAEFPNQTREFRLAVRREHSGAQEVRSVMGRWQWQGKLHRTARDNPSWGTSPRFPLQQRPCSISEPMTSPLLRFAALFRCVVPASGGGISACPRDSHAQLLRNKQMGICA